MWCTYVMTFGVTPRGRDGPLAPGSPSLMDWLHEPFTMGPQDHSLTETILNDSLASSAFEV